VLGWRDVRVGRLPKLALLSALTLLVTAVQLPARPCAAQRIDRPSDERLELPDFAPDDEEEVAPRLEAVPPPPPDAGLSRGVRVYVRTFRIEGTTVFEREVFERTLQPWLDREVDTVDLQDAVDALTKLYVDAGYVSSGALIPDQEVKDGVIRLRVIESALTDVQVEGNRWNRTGYLRRRVLASVSKPVRLGDVEEVLQLLLEEPSIEKVRGELRPGAREGETLLALHVEESLPFQLEGIAANDRSPGVGDIAGRSILRWDGPSGWGDSLNVDLEFTEGLDAQEASYALPLLGRGTTLELRYRRTDSEIVEDFEDLDIESETHTASVGLRHPLWRKPRNQLWIGLRGEWRRNETSLLGRDFSFEPGAEDGESSVALLRAFQEWTLRTRDDVVAARSTATLGIDALGATVHSGSLADGRFFAWLLQVQWARRLPETLRSSQVVLRSDLQLSSDSLLTIERFGIGGRYTVRGYRENRIVRDNGVVGSAELRVPLVGNVLGRDVLELAPFVDIGYGWNDEALETLETLASLGVGLRYRLGGFFDVEAYWAGRLRKVDRLGSTLQDDGVHLRVRLRTP
jgi:hemolysin activation/secretion protein